MHKSKNIPCRVTIIAVAVVLAASPAQCGIDGSKVVSAASFESDLRTLVQGKVVACGPASLEADLSDAAVLGFDLGAARFPGDYYLQADVDFCFNAVIAAPCRSTVLETTQDLLIVQGLYYNPEPACVLNNDTLGQGGSCSR